MSAPVCENCAWWDIGFSGVRQFFNGRDTQRAGVCQRTMWYRSMMRLSNQACELFTRADFSCSEFSPKQEDR